MAKCIQETIFNLFLYIMYNIVHLPTNTCYALNNSDNKHSILFFKEYDDARYVADSLATHMWIYGNLPHANNELYMMKPYQKKKHALDHKLWVFKYDDFSMRRLHEIGLRNLDISIVKNIEWLNDDTYDIDIKHFELDLDLESFANSLHLDHTSVVDVGNL